MRRSFFIGLLFPFLVLRTASAEGRNRVEVTPTPAGADLVTFFRNDVPQLAILRDTLGDSRNGAHLLRQVWDFSYVRPGWKQQIAASIPFFYHRAGGTHVSPTQIPSPLFDLSHPAKGTVSRVLEALAQSNIVDGRGFAFRGPTRSYRGNAADYRNMHLVRSLQIVEDTGKSEDLPLDLRSEDWEMVRGRLLLGQRLLGGFVSNERTARVAARQSTADAEDRAANFDLLRQAAEKNGLYLAALDSSDSSPRQAVLYFARTETPTADQRFDRSFLGIADPWHDTHVSQWTGYTPNWYLDSSGAVAAADDPGVSKTPMIPLALYALDYPRVPLLLIDFHSNRAKRRELVRRATADLATSVFDLSPYSSLSWFTVRTSYLLVRDRQGAALNRSLRQAAYARLRQELLESGGQMDPAFHGLIESRLDAIALNPFEQESGTEVELAWRQYAALSKWVSDPKGLARTLARDRRREFYRRTHTPGSIARDRVLEIASFGIWHPHIPFFANGLDDLSRERRLDAALRILREAADLPYADLVWAAGEIRAAADEASVLSSGDPEAAALVARVRSKLGPEVLPVAPASITSAGQ